MSSKSRTGTRKPPTPAQKPNPSDPNRTRIDLPTTIEVTLRGDEAPRAVQSLTLRPVRVGDLEGAPVANLTVGDLVTIAFRACDVIGDVRAAAKDLPVTVLGPLVGKVEADIERYSEAAEGEDLSGLDLEKPATIALSKTVKFGSEDVTALELQPLTVGDYWDHPQGPAGLGIYPIAHLGGKMARVPSAVIDLLEMRDAGRLGAVVTGFLLGSRRTGDGL